MSFMRLRKSRWFQRTTHTIALDPRLWDAAVRVCSEPSILPFRELLSLQGGVSLTASAVLAMFAFL